MAKVKFEADDEMSLASPKGHQTKRLLEKKGIKSPELVNMVKIDNKTWVSKKNK